MTNKECNIFTTVLRCFEFKSGYNGDITDTIRTCGYDGKITDNIRPNVLTRVHFQSYNGDITALYQVTFFGGHSVDM